MLTSPFRPRSLPAALLATAAVLAAAAPLALPAAASAYYAHVVLPGETLTSVAAQDGLTLSALAAANGLSTQAELVTGTVLQIPPQTAYTAAGSPSVATASEPAASSETSSSETTSAASTSSGTASAEGGSYVVQPGDTLTAIAGRAGTSVAELAALNGLNPDGVLLAGAALRLPGAQAVYVSTDATSSSPAAAATSQPVGTAAEGSPGAPPYPTQEYVSSSEVGSIAAAHGVNPALVQAIGWQESGYNNDVVSSVGAVGVMQILPGTWSWINQDLTGGQTLAPASALSNVTGGALMLRSLVDATGSDALAAASYYQGLSSVEQNGLYPETKQYVADVMALEQRFGG